MCGIAGIIAWHGPLQQQHAQKVQYMAECLYHRGPTHTGYYNSENCMLGNARLAITDTSAVSNLPMQTPDGNVVICYNGFVSNFLELKKHYRLGEKYSFRGNSDTEVLLNLYLENGIDFIRDLNGMFAFCLYDKVKGMVWIVRDMYGIKPVYYHQHNGELYFASELKAIRGLSHFSPQLDGESVYHYFSLGYMPGRFTPYTDVQELRPGNMLQIDLKLGKQQLFNYYSLPNITDDSRTETEAVKRTTQLMHESIERNLISDVPLGITLSGGLDSSMILAIAAPKRKQSIDTFSLKIDAPGFDESYYQQMMASKFKTRHHEVSISPKQIEQALFETIAYLDEPSANGGNVPCYLLAREAAKHVTVLLSGEGGDEIFNGYDTHIAYKASALYRQYVPGILRKGVQQAVNLLPTSRERLSLDFKLKRFTAGAELDIPAAHMYWRHCLTDAEKERLILHAKRYDDTADLFRFEYGIATGKEPLNKLSYLDIYYFFADDLMVKNDRMFMAHSLETRFPLMDRMLAEYVTRIPPHLRVKGFRRRNIQKLAAQSLIPHEIINRRKSGLEIPYSTWLLTELRPLCDKYFSRQQVEKNGLLNYNEVANLWQAHRNGYKDHGRALWAMLVFIIWFDMFVYNNNYRDYIRSLTK